MIDACVPGYQQFDLVEFRMQKPFSFIEMTDTMSIYAIIVGILIDADASRLMADAEWRATTSLSPVIRVIASKPIRLDEPLNSNAWH